MFTGKYLLEDIIDQELEDGGEESLRERMTKFSSHGHHATHEFYTAVRKDLEGEDMPQEFRDLIMNVATNSYGDGGTLVRDLEYAVKQYEERHVKRNALKEFTADLWKKTTGALAVGALVGLAGGAIGTCSSMTYDPAYENRMHLWSQAGKVDSESAEITFESEGRYAPVVLEQRTDAFQGLLKQHKFKTKNKTVVDRIVTAYIHTMQDTGHEHYDMTTNIMQRSSALNPMSMNQVGIYFHDYLRELIPMYIEANRTGPLEVDLEDVMVETFAGTLRLRSAKRSAGSQNYADYIQAQVPNDQGVLKPVFNPEEREFLNQLLYNVSLEIAPHVKQVLD